MTSVLAVENLERSFGDLVAVDGVSFSVAPGETYGYIKVIVIVLAGRVRSLVKPAQRRTPENQQD